jgi:hypothetical protein
MDEKLFETQMKELTKRVEYIEKALVVFGINSPLDKVKMFGELPTRQIAKQIQSKEEV